MANQSTTEMTRETFSNLADKAKDAAGDLAGKAKDATATVAHQAQDLVKDAGQRADDATATVGHSIRSAADTVRSKGPHDGMLGSATSATAAALESTGRYLEEREAPASMAEDVTEMIRRNPLPGLVHCRRSRFPPRTDAAAGNKRRNRRRTGCVSSRLSFPVLNGERRWTTTKPMPFVSRWTRRASLTEKLETLEHQIVETVQGATSAMTETVENVKEAVHDTVSEVKSTVNETVDTVKSTFDIPHHFRRHPWLMLGGAVAVGYLASRILDRVLESRTPAIPPSRAAASTTAGAPVYEQPRSSR